MNAPGGSAHPAAPLPAAADVPAAPAGARGAALLRGILPGGVLCGVVALAAHALGQSLGGPPVLYALLLGLALHPVAQADAAHAGLEFCARAVLRVGVALLGLRITVEQVSALGVYTAVAVVLAVASTVLVGLAAARALGLPRRLGVLSGGASAICGASAALAIAAVLPQSRRAERMTVLVVMTVSLWSTAAMVLYPLLARAAGLAPPAAGLFLGGSIHDVAQVVGAASVLGPAVVDHAVVVKMMRIALLIAVVLAVAIAMRPAAARAGAATLRGGWQRLLPGFLLAFVALAALRHTGWVPTGWVPVASAVSGHCLVLAIAALGLKTSLQSLRTCGWRPVLLLAVEAVWIAAFVGGAAVLAAGP